MTIFQKEWLKKVHVKSDTGMGRNGIKTKIEMQEFISVLKDIPFINMTGIYTHFALAIHEDKSFFNKQLKKWDEMYANIKKIFI